MRSKKIGIMKKVKDENKGSLFKSLGPLVGNALISGRLFKAQAELTKADPDILVEYDVEIPISEGFYLTANIYRSKKSKKQARFHNLYTFWLFGL